MIRFVAGCFMVALVVGCGSDKPAATSEAELANQKLAKLERLAEALAKGPTGPEAVVALDSFRNVDFNPKARPEETQKIIAYYDANIKGKYRGDIATELNNLIELMKKSMAQP